LALDTRSKVREALEEAVEEVEELLAKRRWVLRELRRFGERYGMSTEEFIEAWRSARIPEPEDPELHGDFIAWEALAEELEQLEKRLLERIRVSKDKQ